MSDYLNNDCHSKRYHCEREDLCMGKLSDDVLANEAFMNYDVRPPLHDLLTGKATTPLVWMTAVKDRIRWLSRQVFFKDLEIQKLKEQLAVLHAKEASTNPEVIKT